MVGQAARSQAAAVNGELLRGALQDLAPPGSCGRAGGIWLDWHRGLRWNRVAGWSFAAKWDIVREVRIGHRHTPIWPLGLAARKHRGNRCFSPSGAHRASPRRSPHVHGELFNATLGCSGCHGP